MSEFVPEGQQAPAEETTEAQPEPWYTQVSQEDFEAMRETTQQLREAIAAQEQQQQQQQQGQQYDPEEFLTVGQAMELMNAYVQPLQAFTQEQQLGEAQERAVDIAAAYATEKGYELDPTTTDLILDHANRYMPEMTQKFGTNGVRAAEAAIAQATDRVMEAIQTRNKQYYEQQVNELRGLSRAPRELPASGQQGGQQLVDRGPMRSESDLVSRIFSGTQ